MAPREASFKFVEDYYTADLSERNSAESRWFLSWLENIKGDEVLSLGCGPNLLDDALFFHEAPKTLVGIDINQSNIDFINRSKHRELHRCKDFLNSRKTEVVLLVGNILEKREDFVGRFDAIYAMGVIGMFEERELKDLLLIIVSYLKPNGTFLDIDWTECRLSEDSLEERKKLNWYDTRGPSISEVGMLLQESGLSIKRHDVHSVANPREYCWGKIYGYLCHKS